MFCSGLLAISMPIYMAFTKRRALSAFQSEHLGGASRELKNELGLDRGKAMREHRTRHGVRATCVRRPRRKMGPTRRCEPKMWLRGAAIQPTFQPTIASPHSAIASSWQRYAAARSGGGAGIFFNEPRSGARGRIRRPRFGVEREIGDNGNQAENLHSRARFRSRCYIGKPVSFSMFPEDNACQIGFWRRDAVVAQIALRRDDQLAFPGAVGAAATTPGGRGGEILRVTTLAPPDPAPSSRRSSKAGRASWCSRSAG